MAYLRWTFWIKHNDKYERTEIRFHSPTGLQGTAIVSLFADVVGINKKTIKWRKVAGYHIDVEDATGAGKLVAREMDE